MISRWVGWFLTLTLTMTVSAPAQTSPSAAEVDLSQFQPTDREMFAEAALFIKRRNPGRAIMLLSDLLRYFPKSDYCEEALYRIAACYKDLGRFDEALPTLELLAKNFPQGAWQPSANLLRGEMLAADQRWAEALPFLQKSALTVKLSDAKLRANYLVALTCDNLKKSAEAKSALEFLVTQEKNNPYLDYARVRLAAVLLDAAGADSQRGLTLLKAVLTLAKDANLRGEAGVRAGNFLYGRGDYHGAIDYYNSARQAEAPEFWRKLANLGLVQANFAEKNYAAVIQVYNETKPVFPDGARPQVLFLAAEAYRLAKQNEPALDLYKFLLDQFPGDANAEASAWARILLLKDAANDETFLAETARFIAKFPKSARLPLVQVMRADAYYAAADYKVAAPMYVTILPQADQLQLADDALSGLYFRAGFAFFSLKDYANATLWLTSYLLRFKDGALIPNVLWLKGQAELESKSTEDALLSWGQLIDQYPRFPQREAILWQASLLAGSRQDYAKMGAWLELLTREFPKTPHLAEAHYWLAVTREAAGDDTGALAHWLAARNLDAARYYAEATRHIISILLKKQDVPQLRAEAEKYDQWREQHPQDPAISLDVCEWLGQQLMDGARPADSEPWLRRVLQSSKNGAQRKRAQLRLALLMTSLQNWDAAVRDWTAYRVNFPEETNRSTVLEPLARAYLATGNYAPAHKLAEQILQQNPEGEYNARGRLLLGDLALAQGQHEEAAKVYSAVALLIEHPQLTPLALTKAAQAWRAAGNGAKADEARARLRQQYPDYK
ncbi:MAG: tetratricopeptide repeat protein [Verrucomicrobiales bacterium]|jgi:TolA-binding protein|nr:tetratricopeptide repeat protein [Verrucomicrobiales bacterium]